MFSAERLRTLAIVLVDNLILIIVERRFSGSGISTFKVKSFTGRLIPTRKSDLSKSCNYFPLQIDNPMNVMT